MLFKRKTEVPAADNADGASAQLPVPIAQSAGQQKTSVTVTAKSENIRSLVDSEAIFTGTLELRAGVKIDGMVIGDVVVSADVGAVVVSKGATVEGNITAPRIYVLGTVRGNLNATGVIVATGAQVIGDVSYEAIRVSDGADIFGSLRRRDREKVVENIATGEAVTGSSASEVAPAPQPFLRVASA